MFCWSLIFIFFCDTKYSSKTNDLLNDKVFHYFFLIFIFSDIFAIQTESVQLMSWYNIKIFILFIFVEIQSITVKLMNCYTITLMRRNLFSNEISEKFFWNFLFCFSVFFSQNKLHEKCTRIILRLRGYRTRIKQTCNENEKSVTKAIQYIRKMSISLNVFI